MPLFVELPPHIAQDWLALLYSLTQLIETSGNQTKVLSLALKLIAQNLGILRGSIAIITPTTGKIRINAAYGLNQSQQKRGEYLLGEGITGKVITQGEAFYIEDVSKDPLFLNRTQARDLEKEQISFLCVPICLQGQPVGALSIDILRENIAGLSNDHSLPTPAQLLSFLEIIAGLLAHAAYDSQELLMNNSEFRPKDFVGNSECMRQVYKQIAIVSPSLTTVFLHGESGTGKEMAARAIHEGSSRKNGPFITLNCAALPENLIESELFGHEKGAFTGAIQTRKGRFELANGGTLFLDEIGELSPFVQAKLLRVLQERSFERLGGMHTIHTDARLITATNRDLGSMVNTGEFRRDLLYRLNVFPIYLPPLRERKEDILPLAAYFLKQFAKDKKVPMLSLEAMKILETHSWPGNIRELQNVMERACILVGYLPFNEHQLIEPQHLTGIGIKGLANSRADLVNDTDLSKETFSQNFNHNQNPEFRQSLSEKMDNLEKNLIMDAVARCNGKLNKAAQNLGISQRILGLRMKKYKLDYKNYR